MMSNPTVIVLAVFTMIAPNAWGADNDNNVELNADKDVTVEVVNICKAVFATSEEERVRLKMAKVLILLGEKDPEVVNFYRERQPVMRSTVTFPEQHHSEEWPPVWIELGEIDAKGPDEGASKELSRAQ